MSPDEAFAVAANIEGGDLYGPKWVAEAAAFRAGRQDRMQTVVYGETLRQVVDLFWPDGPVQGLLVFVHGGFWKSTDRETWSHLAAGGLARGWAVALPGYDLCPDVRVSQITRQIAVAVDKLAGLVPGPLVLTGHSAGGHLVARILAPNVLKGSVRGRVERCVPISPLSDLEPLLEATALNAVLRLDANEAHAESPVQMDRPKGVAVEIWVGEEETSAFLDQARLLSEAWAVRQVTVPGRHHFDVIDALIDPDSTLIRFLCGADGK
jgi:pimeloyl-ACP methyl ester carboxylesterase